VFFEKTRGISAGPFHGSVHPAQPYVKRDGKVGAVSTSRAPATRSGAAYFITKLEPDLSTVRLMRYGSNFIPPQRAGDRRRPTTSTPTSASGGRRPTSAFRSGSAQASEPSRTPSSRRRYEGHGPDLRALPDPGRRARRHPEENPGADLVMIYIEQPDGLRNISTCSPTRARPTNPTDPSTIGANQDPAKVRAVQVVRRVSPISRPTWP